MTSLEIRHSFLEFFKSKRATIVPSASSHSIAPSSSFSGTVAKLVAESLIA